MKYIYHHLGLGDHIICNGLIRSMISQNETYLMFVKEHNLESVKFMYRDLQNLGFIIGDDNFVGDYLSNNKIQPNDIIVAGFSSHPKAKSFEEVFYLQNNVPLINRLINFKVDRDYELEMSLFSKYNVKEGEYVFIHDDNSRGFDVDEDLIINKNFPIIRPIVGLTNNVFDYCYLMENSIESHFIDSSFRIIFDSLKLRDDYIFLHIKMKNNNTRNGHNSFNDLRDGNLNFKIID
jgi:hypothetical protein